MRLNRENTLIENNLYPFAGLKDEDVKKKFVSALEPHQEIIDQIQSAMFLHNIPLFSVILSIIVGFWILCLVLYRILPKPVFMIILIPLFHLLYCFDLHKFVKKFFGKLPELSENDPCKLWTIEQIVDLVHKPALLIWRIGFFIYRTFLCPNPVDTIVFILATIVLGFLGSRFNFVIIAGIKLILFFCAPAILTKTPAGPFLKGLLNKQKPKQE